MKKTIILIGCLLVAGLQAQQIFTSRTFRLEFEYDVTDTNLVAFGRQTTNLTELISAWPIVAVKVGVDAGSNIFPTRVSADPHKTFYCVSVSNEWGEVFSEVLESVPPRQNGKVRLAR